ncbi:MAG TPA: WD40 repeat domain-containing protein [Pseudonocardia sp.]|nr:WD40 repeat domain-containing protein [Pseudonocardia sp.]
MNMTHGGWASDVTSRVLGTGSSTFSLVPVTLADGRAVVFGIANDVIRRWDPVDGSEAGPPIFPAQPPSHSGAVVDRTGKPWIVLAYPTNDGTFTRVHFMDAATGLESRPPLTGPQLVGTRFWTLPLPDGRVLLAVNRDFVGNSPTPDGDPSTFYHTTTQLWDPETGSPVGPLHQPRSQDEVSPRGTVVVDGKVMLIDIAWPHRLWDIATIEAGSWTPAVEFTFERGAGTPAIVPLADGRAVAVAGVSTSAVGGSTHLVAVDVHDGRPIVPPAVLPAFVSQVVRIPLADGQDLVAVVGDDRAVRLFDPNTLAPVGQPLTGHAGSVDQVVPVRVPDGRVLLATSGRDGVVRVWEPAKPPPTAVQLSGHDGAVLALAAPTLADGRVPLASGGRDKTIRLWDPATATAVGVPLTGHTGPILALAATPTLLVSGSADNSVRCWDPGTGAPIGSPLTGHTGPVRALATATPPGGGALIVSAGTDATVRRWDAATGAPVGPALTGHTGAIHAATAVDVAGTVLIATAGDDAAIRLWNLATGTPAGPPLTGHTGPIRALASITVNTVTLLASAGDDTTIRLWNPATAQPVGTPLTGHTNTIRALTAFPRPHGPTLLASTGDDGGLRLWDLTAASPVGRPVPGPTGAARAAIPRTVGAGATLLAIGADDTLALWTIP